MSGKNPAVAQRHYWIDKPRNVLRIVRGLCVLGAVLFFTDALYEKHPHFSMDGWFGFYAIFGFVVCVSLVLLAKWLRTVLMRPEDYYDR
ncbi:MAG: hypothetical protein EXR11_14630 [Rhodospirillaceae bacterium]|nr:hypothetical protein [Rhodospirillaceae bacterium]